MIEDRPEPDRDPDPDRAGSLDGAHLLSRELDRVHAELVTARHQLREKDRQQQAASEREAVLLSELQHRVRNMLAVTRSLLTRTVAAGGSIEDIVAHFERRLDVLARYQSTQAFGPSRAIDLETIIHDELVTISAASDLRVTVGGPQVLLRHDTALLVGLAIHELATNSIKFGTLSTTDTRSALSISWGQHEGRITFVWDECRIRILGGAPARIGFGRNFIEQALPYQLGARTFFETGPGRLTCTIEFPIHAEAVPGRLGGAY